MSSPSISIVLCKRPAHILILETVFSFATVTREKKDKVVANTDFLSPKTVNQITQFNENQDTESSICLKMTKNAFTQTKLRINVVMNCLPFVFQNS